MVIKCISIIREYIVDSLNLKHMIVYCAWCKPTHALECKYLHFMAN